jgi:hypothetical protein
VKEWELHPKHGIKYYLLERQRATEARKTKEEEEEEKFSLATRATTAKTSPRSRRGQKKGKRCVVIRVFNMLRQ